MAFQLVGRNAIAGLDEGEEGSIRVVLPRIDENLLFFQRSDGRPFTCLGEQAGRRRQNKGKEADFKWRRRNNATRHSRYGETLHSAPNFAFNSPAVKVSSTRSVPPLTTMP